MIGIRKSRNDYVIARRAFALSNEAIFNHEEIASGEKQKRPRNDMSSQ